MNLIKLIIILVIFIIITILFLTSGGIMLSLGFDCSFLYEKEIIQDYFSSFIMISNCTNGENSQILKTPIFCFNEVSRNCYDVSDKAIYYQTIGLGLLIIGIILSIPFLILYIFIRFNKYINRKFIKHILKTDIDK
jgi:hypothetical protein